MAHHLRIATSEARPRNLGEYQETQTANDIMRSLKLVRSIEGTAMTMIAGVPGVGKSMTLKEFCKWEGPDAIYLSVASGEGKASNVAAALMELWREVANGKSLTLVRSMLASFMGTNAVLIIDEAQYLNRQGAEWLRALTESANCDLVLSGDQKLIPLVASIPQLESRMSRKVLIQSVPSEDVQVMAANSGFNSPEAVRVLYAVARMRGGLRNVENVLRTAELFAGGDMPNASHLKAAIIEMKLAPMGEGK